MRAIATIFLTAIYFLCVPALVLTTPAPAYAGGGECRSSGDDCHEKPPATQTVIVGKDDNTARDVLAAIFTGCAIEPVVTAYVWPAIKSAFTWKPPKYRNLEWFKCLGGPDKPAPPTDTGTAPYSDVTPVIPADNGQVYIFKGR